MSQSAHPQVGHVVPLRVLFGVLGTLLLMTFVTVAVSWIDLGRYNLWLAMGIAVFKASLVLLFFMHLKYDKPFNAMVIIVSMVLVVLFIGIALTDTAQYEQNLIPGYAPSIKTNPQ
jgi:cytochrome c oxidase subunit 4